MNTLFPIFIKPDQLKILLVGGGEVSLEKLEALLNNCFEAQIKVVSLDFSSKLLEFVSGFPNVKIEKRRFESRDIDGVDLIITALGSRKKSQEIRTLAREKNILFNAADKAELCDFYLCSVVQKGEVKIGISSNGKSPGLTKRLRQYFEAVLPDNVSDLVQNLNTLRSKTKGDLKRKIKISNEATKALIGSV